MGVVLPKPVTTKLYERHGSNLLRVGSGCVNGYRENMEDAHLVYTRDNWAFFAVFDGHAGDKCSAYLEEEWLRVLTAESFPISDERLKEMALEIDLKFWKAGTDGGSTGTFFLAKITGNTVSMQIGNVGDSRVLACKDGQPLSLTEDHKPNDPKEMRRIIECGGRVENNRVDGSLAVSRAFGDSDYKRGTGDQLNQKVIALADVTHCELTAGSSDFAVLACDGVFEGEFSNDQVIEYIKGRLATNNDLAVVSGDVCEESIERGSKDNISCMIVQFVADPSFNKPLECVAGPFTHPGHAGFRKVYAFMAEKGGITVGQALEQRFDYLASKPEGVEVEEELSGFKTGPPATLTGADRTAWFTNYFDGLAAESASATQPVDPRLEGLNPEQVQRIQLLQQHLGIPLSMIMQLMADQGDADGDQ